MTGPRCGICDGWHTHAPDCPNAPWNMTREAAMRRETAAFYDLRAISLLWRTGRKNGRTIYAVLDADGHPSDDDIYIGSLDTPELSATAVASHNGARGPGPERWVRVVDVVAAIRARYADTSQGMLCSDFREAADFVERVFGLSEEGQSNVTPTSAPRS